MTEGLTSAAEALVTPWTSPGSRTWWPALLVFAVLGVTLRRAPLGHLPAVVAAHLRHPSTVVDVQLLLIRRLGVVVLGGGGVAAGLVLARRVASALSDLVGAAPFAEASPTAVMVGYSAALFVAWDLSRYLLHRALHEVPALWAVHEVHHSAEVLTPLTFHRLHPLEGLLYAARGAVVTGVLAGAAFALVGRSPDVPTLFGVHGVGLVLNVTVGNLRHSAVWLPYPRAVERWLISPAQHQLHHSAAPADHGCNYGTWLAVWDRLGGTLRHADAPPARLGVLQPGHDPHDAVDALLSPLRAWSRRLIGTSA